MKLSIQGKQLTLTDAIKNYAETKIGKVEKYHDGIIDMNITLSATKLKTGNSHTAEVLVFLSGKTLKASAVEEDLYTSIDQVAEIIENQLKKHQEKYRKASGRMDKSKGWKYHPEDQTFINDEVKKVVQVYLPSKPMSLEESILQLETLDKNFFVFINEDTLQMNVVYKRKDGDYGYIVN